MIVVGICFKVKYICSFSNLIFDVLLNLLMLKIACFFSLGIFHKQMKIGCIWFHAVFNLPCKTGHNQFFFASANNERCIPFRRTMRSVCDTNLSFQTRGLVMHKIWVRRRRCVCVIWNQAEHMWCPINEQRWDIHTLNTKTTNPSQADGVVTSE